VLSVKAPLKLAEPIRKKMVAAGIFDTGYLIEKEDQYIFFPATKKAPGFNFVERKGRKRRRKPRSFREALEGKLPPEDWKSL